MSLRLDHLAIAAETLEEGAAWAEMMLGVPLESGGRHPHMGTHNRLLSLGPDLYLEVITVDPGAVPPDRPRWFDLDRFQGEPRLHCWSAACDDLDATVGASELDLGEPVSLVRGDLLWRMAIPDSGVLPFDNVHPALIEWQGQAHPTQRLPDKDVRLNRLTVRHPDAAGLSAALATLDDPRVVLENGKPGLSAELETPRGPVHL